MTVELGVIADDITGACDVAAGVTDGGARRRGAARRARSDGASVGGMRDRRAEITHRAAGAGRAPTSVAAARALRAWGARRLYQKYCSTFDSTDRGNIGPVADALVDELGCRRLSSAPRSRPPWDAPCTEGTSSSETGCCRSPRSRSIRSLPCTTPIWCASSAARRRTGSASCRSRACARGRPRSSTPCASSRADGTRHILLDAVTDGDLDAAAAAVAASDDLLLGGAARARRRAGTAARVGSGARGGPGPGRAGADPLGKRVGAHARAGRRLPGTAVAARRRRARGGSRRRGRGRPGAFIDAADGHLLWSPPPRIPTTSRACRSAGGESAPPP